MLKLKFTNSKNIITQFPSIGPKANPYNTYSSSPENIVKLSLSISLCRILESASLKNNSVPYSMLSARQTNPPPVTMVEQDWG